MTEHAAVRLLALPTIALLAACGVAPDAEPADLAIIGAQVVDGTGGEPVADSVILIGDGRVRAAGLGFSYPGGSSSGFTNTSTTEKEARAVVCEQAALGAHFTKMWINEVAEAARRSIPRRRPRAARLFKRPG